MAGASRRSSREDHPAGCERAGEIAWPGWFKIWPARGRRVTPEAGVRPPSTADAGTGLKREIGPWSLVALTVNCVVGAGVLGLPGRVFALAGAETGWVLGAAGLLALAVALCLAELAGRFDGPGGPALYLDRAFGPLAGFAGGWLSWAATVLGAASLLDLLAGLVTSATGAPKLVVVVVTALGMSGFVMTGARRSALASSLLTVLKVALLAAVAIAGLVGPASPARPLAGEPQPLAALVLVFFAFVGFERPTAMAGEVRRAQRNVPLALMAAMLAIGLLYAGVFAACLRDLPDLARSDQPVGRLAVRALGPAAARGLDAGAAVIVLGTLASQWITAPRLLLALAGDGRLPAALARLAPRRRTPDAAVALTGASAVLLALAGGFAGAATASSAARLLVFLGCGAAVLRLRLQPAAPAARFRLPGGAVIAIGVVLSCGALLASARAQGPPLAALVVIGGAVWLSTALGRRRRRPR